MFWRFPPLPVRPNLLTKMFEMQVKSKKSNPLAMRALGHAFKTVGRSRGIESFADSGERLLSAADELSQPPEVLVVRRKTWILESLLLTVMSVGLTLVLGWFVKDYWTASWAMAPIVLLFAWLPWEMESRKRFMDEREAFERQQEWRRRMVFHE